MALPDAPKALQAKRPFVDSQTGMLTAEGQAFLEGMHRQWCAGHVIVPCLATGKNEIILEPEIQAEGGFAYVDGIAYCFAAAETSDGPVTAFVRTGKYGDLATIKAFVDAGANQADSGDIVAGSIYLFVYHSTLDAGGGGFVAK